MVGRRSSFRAALVTALVIALAPASGFSQPQASPSDPAVTQATARFFEGQRLYNENKFDEALLEFRASFTAAPSPNSHLYIARCLRQLGRLADAYGEYAQVILEAADRATSEAKYAATQKAAAEERAALRPKLAMLSVAMPAEVVGASMRIGSEVIVPGRWQQEIAVDPGRVILRVEAPGRAPFESELTLVAGDKQKVTVELREGSGGSSSGDPEPGRGDTPWSLPLRPLAYASAGVGVVGFVMFGVLGSLASSKYEELDRKCTGRCGPEHQEEVDSGRAQTTASNVGLALGILGVAGGAGLFAADLILHKPASQRSAQPASLAVHVSPDPTAPSIVLSGHF